MTHGQKVSRLDVFKYELAVEFSKLKAHPFDLDGHNHFEALLERLPDYHDGPRNSPFHLYAALADERLLWRKTEIPVAQIIRGPGDGGQETEIAVEAEGFLHRFVKLAQERYAGHEAFELHFRDTKIRFPTVPCVLVNYKEAVPRMPGAKRDYGPVYRLQDGYHRAFQMILREKTTIPAFAASCKNGDVRRGNYRHVDRIESGRWVARTADPGDGASTMREEQGKQNRSTDAVQPRR